MFLQPLHIHNHIYMLVLFFEGCSAASQGWGLTDTHCYKKIEYSRKIKLLNMSSIKNDTRENHLQADDVLLTKMRKKLLE